MQEWLSVYEQWESDPDPANDVGYVDRLADLASDASLPCYAEDGETNSGPAGWRRWAGTTSQNTKCAAYRRLLGERQHRGEGGSNLWGL